MNLQEVKEIIELVDGTPLNPEVDLNIKIRGGIGADLISCKVCARNCPVDAISGERRQVHNIDQNNLYQMWHLRAGL